MRARVFWIALPIAVVVALWAGPGLGTDDVTTTPPSAVGGQETEPRPPPRESPAGPPPSAPAGSAPEVAPTEPECEAPHDPGPDGDG